ncbi:DUF1801 domain-containing protein [Nonlabens ponticola]|uniref:DUF1801 domain-containing protein n=1 Tax=Nonlabens ponticola TaxID=2496866 RepID=A0A3S9MZI0_9FLAO|nr:DUF1801 domain-containing protein [Nonlabens ponticola]AZQ44567.1 DUF1801 domain-containing protein [Nonlabens ponticola]
MTSTATTPEQYLDELTEERHQAVRKLRDTVRENLPDGFEESMGYGMIAYQVPLSSYPKGYHAGKEPTPLPFINIASQKNHIALYHMGLYSRPDLLDWFKDEFPKHSKRKLDMGKSCIRFKNIDDIPYDLIGDLCGKVHVQDWIKVYESVIKR